MPFPAFAQYKPCCSSPHTATSRPATRLQRPRGLWNAARETPHPRLDNPPAHTTRKRPSPSDVYEANHRFYATVHHHENEEDHIFSEGEYNSDSGSSSSSSRKRRRVSPESPPTTPEEESKEDEVIFWDYSRKCSPHPERVSKWTTRTKLMDTTTTVGPGQPPSEHASCDLDDWEDLKELFGKAVEMYESQDPSETIPLLRGVIHECHRFMKFYQDPSVLFATLAPADAEGTPQQERIIREWLAERSPLYPPPGAAPRKKDQGQQTSSATTSAQDKAAAGEKKCKCKDLPTAFHAIFGTTLFLFGNLIAQDSALALEGEPSIPTPYWLSAVDVFQIGENLPIRTSGRGCQNAPEDWRMAVVWGRTLVNLADEVLTRQKANITPGPSTNIPSLRFSRTGFPSVFQGPPRNADEPDWPPESPFAMIALRRTPASFRISLSTVSPDELLHLAQDQFSRGIFHMPHPQRGAKNQRATIANIFPQRPPLMQKDSTSSIASVESNSSTISAKSTNTANTTATAAAKPAAPTLGSFSRAKELYAIGSDVLLIAEKLDLPSERHHWAKWANGIFNQMKMESMDVEDAWKAPIASSRGRCFLVMGSAKAEEMEGALEKGDMEVLKTEEAEEAREWLRSAVVYLQKAREALSSSSSGKSEGAVDVPGAGSSSDSSGSASTTPTNTTSSSMSVNPTIVVVPEGEHEELEAILDDDAVVAEDDIDETFEQSELRTLLAEALLTLANLTVDNVEREGLYAKAQREGRGSFQLDEGEGEEFRMDESG